MREHELVVLARTIAKTLGTAERQLEELTRGIAALNLPSSERLMCPECGPFAGGPAALAEHRYTSHGGPLPAHWAAADTRAESEAA